MFYETEYFVFNMNYEHMSLIKRYYMLNVIKGIEVIPDRL